VERAWPEEAADFEAGVRGSLNRAGGVELARRCEAQPDLRSTEVRPILEELGLFDLDVRAGAAEAASAARAMRAAGAVVCPWPLVQQLAVPNALRGEIDAIYLRDGDVHRVEHLDIAGRALALDILTEDVRELWPASGIRAAPLDPFGVACETRAAEAHNVNGAFGTYLVLASFWVVGTLAHAKDLAAAYARERRQFGRRIADFGEVQWLLSDIAVAHDSLFELASFSLGRMIDDRLTLADALALHLTMVESARSVMSCAHQVLGAIGLCEEHDLTVLNRHLQPFIRRPCGVNRIVGMLADEIAKSGFDNLYPVPAAATVS
jgi:acyl-CoA dehydrogenase